MIGLVLLLCLTPSEACALGEARTWYSQAGTPARLLVRAESQLQRLIGDSIRLGRRGDSEGGVYSGEVSASALAQPVGALLGGKHYTAV